MRDQVVTTIYKALPYSEQIEDLDTVSEDNAIRFSWRGGRYRIGYYKDNMSGPRIGSVETVGDSVLIGDREAILMTRIVQQLWSRLYGK